jgi:DNA polymerase
VPVVDVTDFAGWRSHARALLAQGVAPEQVAWQVAHGDRALDLETPTAAPDVNATGCARVPRELLALLEAAACHRDPRRWSVMYRVLWRVQQGERNLLQDAADADLRTLHLLARAVDRECHKAKAFVRFRETPDADGPARYVAWFEPEHDILARVAPFFVDRFAGMRWAILTPRGAAEWDGRTLHLRTDAHDIALPAHDQHENLWRAYYASIFNPGRLNERMMFKEMPARYWKNLPETREVPKLKQAAQARTQAMLRTAGKDEDRWRAHAPAVPLVHMATGDLNGAIRHCRRCPLWRDATQAVCGVGPKHAAIMLVGEQPGDEEDLKGLPFVGPAGRLLDNALQAARLPRDSLYITNAVKHFKWEPRGKRRIHKTPAQSEVAACLDWLEQEIAAVQPRVIVALGATALSALTGRREPLGGARGREVTQASGVRLLATYHPSAILRADEHTKSELHAALLEDLSAAARLATAPA